MEENAKVADKCGPGDCEFAVDRIPKADVRGEGAFEAG